MTASLPHHKSNNLNLPNMWIKGSANLLNKIDYLDTGWVQM